MHKLSDVGGTEGGLRLFLWGSALTLLGAYLFADRVMVHGGYWSFYRSEGTSFGITLLLVLIGVGRLFYEASSKLGWVLTIGGLVVIFTGIIANLQLHFRETSLWATLLMLSLLASGIGMVFRSLRPAR